ncbi:hypothetical protein EV192_104243 [Actinocrispum wychmicini]|uniref:Uncharacterized protein n=1 Tax=Actinocrispum wychmicini TaxID=1213861 RepID=A0A4R2JLE3_9PSEU|nr:hypothetical protein EV192_104243 [Actinocrispum wychmicini]
MSRCGMDRAGWPRLTVAFWAASINSIGSCTHSHVGDVSSVYSRVSCLLVDLMPAR